MATGSSYVGYDPLAYLQNSQFQPSVPYAEPVVLLQPDYEAVEFNQGDTQEFIPYGVNNWSSVTVPNVGAAIPNPYNQGSLRLPGTTVVGQAPTQGVYTGVEDYG